jgi:hypothetical protein
MLQLDQPMYGVAATSTVAVLRAVADVAGTAVTVPAVRASRSAALVARRPKRVRVLGAPG